MDANKKVAESMVASAAEVLRESGFFASEPADRPQTMRRVRERPGIKMEVSLKNRLLHRRCRGTSALQIRSCRCSKTVAAQWLQLFASARSRSHQGFQVVVLSGNIQRNSPTARAAPITCASMNAGTSPGRIPAKVSVKERASVTAGLANEVDDVNQYAAVM